MDFLEKIRSFGERLDAAAGAPRIESNRDLSGREAGAIIAGAAQRAETLERIQLADLGAPAVQQTQAYTGLSPETTAQTYGQ